MYFLFIVLSYPEWTVRKFDPRPLPRVDPKPIVENFLNDLLRSNSAVVGTRLRLNTKQPVNILNNIVKSHESGDSVGWLRPSIPVRQVDQTPHQHSQSWINKPQLMNFSVKVTMPDISDDSGYEASSNMIKCEESFSSLDQSKPVKMKPTFISKLMSRVDCPDPAKKEVPAFKPDFSRPAPTFSSNESVNPSLSDLSTMKGDDEVMMTPSTRRPGSESLARKKPSVSNVDINKLISDGREQEISKLNTATLLNFCRLSNIKEAKAKSKKEDLLRMILSFRSNEP